MSGSRPLISPPLSLSSRNSAEDTTPDDAVYPPNYIPPPIHIPPVVSNHYTIDPVSEPPPPPIPLRNTSSHPTTPSTPAFPPAFPRASVSSPDGVSSPLANNVHRPVPLLPAPTKKPERPR